MTENMIIAVKILLLSLSAILLIITLNIYRILPQLRKMLDTCTLNMVVCGIVVAFMKINLLFEQKYSRSYNIYAPILSVFSVAFFMWMKCAMLTVLRTIILGNSNIHDKIWHYINIYAWFPSICLIVFPFIYTQFYSKAFNNKFLYVGLVVDVHYIIVCAVLTFLILLCFWIILTLSRIQSDEISHQQFMSFEYMFNLSFKILIIAGSTWILGKFSLFFPENMSFLGTLFDCFDCGSGIAIFLVLIYWRPRVKKLLASRSVCGIVLPGSWATLEQVE